jgi:hypothetical protein
MDVSEEHVTSFIMVEENGKQEKSHSLLAT